MPPCVCLSGHYPPSSIIANHTMFLKLPKYDRGPTLVRAVCVWLDHSGGLVEMAASLVSAESTAAAARDAQLRPLRPVESDLTTSASVPVTET